jgi:hypothetical protein
MTNAADPAEELVPLAQSWLRPPQLKMPGLEPSYTVLVYDPTQRAYVLSCGQEGAKKFEFTLAEAAEGDKHVFIENPAFVLKDWGASDVELKADGKSMKAGKEYRLGYEKTHTGSDLILWLNMRSTKKVSFEISPR